MFVDSGLMIFKKPYANLFRKINLKPDHTVNKRIK